MAKSKTFAKIYAFGFASFWGFLFGYYVFGGELPRRFVIGLAFFQATLSWWYWYLAVLDYLSNTTNEPNVKKYES